MSKKPDQYWLKSGFLSLLQNLSNVFFGFASFYLLVRLLTKEDFGTWALFMTVTTILETTRNGLIQNALIKFLSAATDKEKPYITGASFLNAGIFTVGCIGLIMLSAGYLADLWDSPSLIPMFRFYTIVYLFSGVLTQFQFVEQAHLRFHSVFITTSIRQGSFFLYVLFCHVFSYPINLVDLVLVQISTALIATFISYLYVRPYLNIKWSDIAVWRKQMFNYGKYSFGTSVSSMLLGSISQIMLGAIVSKVAAGIYNIAIRVINLIEIPTNSVSAIVFPQSARRSATEGVQAAKYLYEKSVGTILAILLPGLIFLMIFSEFAISIIAGKQYLDAVPLLRVTVLYCTLIPFGRQFGTILDSVGKTTVTFRMVLFSAILNTVVSYFCIKSFGVMGAVYGTCITQTIAFIICQFILKRLIGVQTLGVFKYTLRFYPELLNRITKRHKNQAA